MLDRLKFFLPLVFLLCSCLVFAAPTAPTPGDAILIISVNNSYDNTMVANAISALNALPVAQRPTITQVQVTLGNKNGIYDELQAAGINLANYCQVWDMRFMDTNNLCCQGTIQEDTITTTGANNDEQLFTNFLQQGGHLYIQADNEGFYGRNEGVTTFINDAISSGTVGYPSVITGTHTWNVFDNTAPDFFQTNTSSLSTLGSDYPGAVPLGQSGGGKVLINDGSSALAILWNSGQLKAGNGKLMVMYDTNTIQEAMTGYDAYVRNMYTTMSTCYNFTVSKTVSPATVCIGQQATYSICYQNTGTRAIPNAQVWDTIPTCLGYSSATPAPSGNNANMYYWNIGTVNPGASACVNINVNALQLPPCP